jgi:hypothetical protein
VQTLSKKGINKDRESLLKDEKTAKKLFEEVSKESYDTRQKLDQQATRTILKTQIDIERERATLRKLTAK